LKAQIEKGEAFGLAVLTVAGIDDLIKQGKLVGATRTNLANSGAGVAVRGAPKPDISTVEAFKRALLNAKSVAYVKQGGTGIYLKALLPRLGITDALKDKIKLLPPENPAARAIANGEAEIGMTQISEILPYAGAELVGPFPAESSSSPRLQPRSERTPGNRSPPKRSLSSSPHPPPPRCSRPRASIRQDEVATNAEIQRSATRWPRTPGCLIEVLTRLRSCGQQQVSAHRDRRNRRACGAPDFERRHNECEFLHVLCY
jgi:Bacterial extracellular solute-binding protein